jgi:vacuolar-type H+-ATPase subunit D/Vma8
VRPLAPQRAAHSSRLRSLAGDAARAAALDAAVAKLRAVLDRMLELESINEVIERLRGVIRVQEQIRDDTLERQRRRGREALESP